MPQVRHRVNFRMVMIAVGSMDRKGKSNLQIDVCFYETKSLVLPRWEMSIAVN